MMTQEEAVAWCEAIKARLRGDDTIEDVATEIASKIADVETEHLNTWCEQLIDGTKQPKQTKQYKKDNPDVVRYIQRLEKTNMVLAKNPKFRDAMKRVQDWLENQEVT